MPTLANGHLGFTVFGDSVFMNGVYNGKEGDSRRARIPNWMNVGIKATNFKTDASKYCLNTRDGYFKWYQNAEKGEFEITQRTYAHRYFNRALIYDLNVHRQESKGEDGQTNSN